MGSGEGDAEGLAEERDLEVQRFSATTSCGVMWDTPESGSTLWGRPASSSARDSCKVWAATTLSSASPWISSSGRRRPFAGAQHAAAVVHLGLRVRVAEVALGVVRVIEAPLGHRCARDRGMEHVGPPEHGERGEVATERPTADRDAFEIHLRMRCRDEVQGVDLILEHGSGEVEVHGPLPRAASSGRAAPVDREHREPLVSEPLGGQERARARTTV